MNEISFMTYLFDKCIISLLRYNLFLKPMFEAAKPSRVLHIRGVPNDCTEGEVIHLGLPFGRMTNLVIARKKNQVCFKN